MYKIKHLVLLLSFILLFDLLFVKLKIEAYEAPPSNFETEGDVIVKKLKAKTGEALSIADITELLEGKRFYFIVDKDILVNYPHLEQIEKKAESLFGWKLEKSEQILLYMVYINENNWALKPISNVAVFVSGELWILRNKITKKLEDVRLNFDEKPDFSFREFEEFQNLEKAPKPRFKDILEKDKI